MCGICGLVGDHDPALLDRMLVRLVHRGPDEEGTHHDVGIAFGVRRLRVIDLSVAINRSGMRLAPSGR